MWPSGAHFLVVKCGEGDEMSLPGYQRLPHTDLLGRLQLPGFEGWETEGSLQSKSHSDAPNPRAAKGRWLSSTLQGFLTGLKIESA